MPYFQGQAIGDDQLQSIIGNYRNQNPQAAQDDQSILDVMEGKRPPNWEMGSGGGGNQQPQSYQQPQQNPYMGGNPYGGGMGGGGNSNSGYGGYMGGGMQRGPGGWGGMGNSYNQQRPGGIGPGMGMRPQYGMQNQMSVPQGRQQMRPGTPYGQSMSGGMQQGRQGQMGMRPQMGNRYGGGGGGGIGPRMGGGGFGGGMNTHVMPQNQNYPRPQQQAIYG